MINNNKNKLRTELSQDRTIVQRTEILIRLKEEMLLYLQKFIDFKR